MAAEKQAPEVVLVWEARSVVKQWYKQTDLRASGLYEFYIRLVGLGLALELTRGPCFATYVV